VEIAHLLIEHGADVTAWGDDGRTPLDVAMELRNVDLIYILIEGHTDVTTPAQPTQDRGRLMYYAGVLLVAFGLFAALYLHFKQT
jgi:ankyrin repeat protein